ncbi:MAG: trehalose-phosphatase [Terriglobales bacterium]
MMRYILASRCRPVLTEFAASKGLIAFDFDGTLAPLASRPERAAIRRTTRRLLSRLTTLYPCVVASGRARGDVRVRLQGVNVVEILGNHGIEPWNTSPKIQAAVKRWKARLEKPLADFSGVVLEDKKYSLAVHYRHARRKEEVQRTIVQVARALRDARLVGGIEVVNLLPRGGPNKGLAVKRALVHCGCDAVLYAGDDDTDEDVFTLGSSVPIVSIRVGRNGESCADYYLRTQKEIERLIRVLIELRAARQEPPQDAT